MGDKRSELLGRLNNTSRGMRVWNQFIWRVRLGTPDDDNTEVRGIWVM